jgi:hypothetical protein
MTIYEVWTRDEFEPDLLALFTNEAEARIYAERNNGRVLQGIAFTTADEADAYWGFGN